MANQVDICNGALTKIGANEINSLDDPTKAARKCKLRYNICRKYVLRSHPWRAIRKFASISPETTKPPMQYNYQFILPPDLIRLWLVTNVNGKPRRDYEKVGNKIYANWEMCYIKYGVDEVDAEKYDDMMVETLSLYLAKDIGYSITQDRGIVSDVNAEYEAVMRRAKSVDSKEDFPRVVRGNQWLEERQTNVHSPVSQYPQLQ